VGQSPTTNLPSLVPCPSISHHHTHLPACLPLSPAAQEHRQTEQSRGVGNGVCANEETVSCRDSCCQLRAGTTNPLLLQLATALQQQQHYITTTTKKERERIDRQRYIYTDKYRIKIIVLSMK
jgi:hypothetical protein